MRERPVTRACNHPEPEERKANDGKLPGVCGTSLHDICRGELLPSETELGPDRGDGLAVQHLDRPREYT